MLSADHKLSIDGRNPGKELLIVQARVAHKAQAVPGKDGARHAQRALDLPVLTPEVDRVGEPVGVARSGNGGIDDGGREGGITAREAGFALKTGWGTLAHGTDTGQGVGVGFLEVDR